MSQEAPMTHEEIEREFNVLLQRWRYWKEAQRIYRLCYALLLISYLPDLEQEFLIKQGVVMA